MGQRVRLKVLRGVPFEIRAELRNWLLRPATLLIGLAVAGAHPFTAKALGTFSAEERFFTGLLLLGLLAIWLWGSRRLRNCLRAARRGAVLGDLDLRAQEEVLVRVEGEGHALWCDIEGNALPCTPEEAWRAWLGFLGSRGFPDAPFDAGGFYLAPLEAEAPQLRRHPDRTLEQRTEGIARVHLPIWKESGLAWLLFVLLLVVTAALAWFWEPAIALLVGIPVLLAVLYYAYGCRARVLDGPVQLAWRAQTRDWALRTGRGRIVHWNPAGALLPLRRPPSSWRSRDSGEWLALFQDDWAHACWRAGRR